MTKQADQPAPTEPDSTETAPLKDPADATAPPEASKTYGKRVARGAVWFGLSILVTKGSTFLSQLALGWLLTKRDYGLYATALACSILVVAFKDAGSRKILLHEGERYAQLAKPVFWLAMMFNLVAGLLLAAAAPVATRLLDAPGLTPVILTIALALPVSTFGTIQRTKLSIDLRFKSISTLTAASTIVRHASTVLFALLGFGPMSFALPLILVGIFEGVAGRYLVGPLPTEGRLTWAIAKDFVLKARWLMLSTLALALALQGDYLAVSAIQTQEVLGVYFFAFQLTVAISTPFSSAMSSLLTPSLTRLQNDTPRQAMAFLKSMRVLSSISAPLCVGAALVAGPAIHLLWAGKWDAAIPAVQMLALSLPIRLLTPLALSLVESRGQWKLSAGMLAADAIGNVAAAAGGALMGAATTIAAWISIERIIVSAGQSVASARLVGLSAWKMASATLAPLLACIAAAAGVLLIERLLPTGMNSLVLSITRSALFGILLLAMGLTIFRQRAAEMLSFSPWERKKKV